MSVPVISKSSLLSSSSTIDIEEESPPKLVVEKQGIVSILRSDTNEKGSKASSLRRTLSADMSSKKWLAQNGMKKVASSQHLAMTTIDSSSSDDEYDDEDEYGQNPRRSDIWSQIISQKEADGAVDNAPPYVHPLVRRSTSSLSEKSLEICTESLGSETGSDVFSSYPPSEEGDVEEEKNLDSSESEILTKEEFQAVKYNYSSTNNKKSSTPTTRTFPPPLPSLARGDGPSLHMHSHRKNGRLVLEAVTLSASKNFFKAQRQNGRLLLTLANNHADNLTKPNQFEEVLDISQENNEEEETVHDEVEEEVIETDYLYRSVPKLAVASEVINVHRSAKMLKKMNEIPNKNQTWLNKAMNKVVDGQYCEEQITKNQPHSLPPLPVAAAVSSAATATFNSYEYFWRAKPTVASVINSPTGGNGTQSSVPFKKNSNKGYEQKELILVRGNKADCLVPLLRGCKKPGRSLLFWEPHCIATS